MTVSITLAGSMLVFLKPQPVARAARKPTHKVCLVSWFTCLEVNGTQGPSTEEAGQVFRFGVAKLNFHQQVVAKNTLQVLQVVASEEVTRFIGIVRNGVSSFSVQ